MSPPDRHQQAGFETLVRPHLERLYRLANRLADSKSEAEDLFQDVLTKVFGRLDDLVAIEDTAPWLCRVMYNHFIDNKRRFARERLRAVTEDQLPGQSVDALPGPGGPEADGERADDVEDIQRALAVLSDDHRLVVLLHDVEGYKLTEIQELTGTPTGTLKSRLHRARARLREILEKAGTFGPP